MTAITQFSRGIWSGRSAAYCILSLVSLTTIAPLFFMIITALKSNAEIYSQAPSFLPVAPSLANFAEALGRSNFLLYITNSFLYAGGATICMLILASMAGYALARLRFPGRAVIFVSIIALLLVPWETHLIPNFLTIRFFPLAGGNDIFGQGGSGFVNTFPGLIIPGAVTPFGIFLMRQFFSTLPREIEEAAIIDGASHLRILVEIALPLSRPALATLGILTFVGTWNAFTWPLVVTNSASIYTIQLALQVFRESSPIQDWGILMAASTISVLPLILVFMFGQKYFIAGMAYSGLKG